MGHDGNPSIDEDERCKKRADDVICPRLKERVEQQGGCSTVFNRN
jgi:hypothetical protein